MSALDVTVRSQRDDILGSNISDDLGASLTLSAHNKHYGTEYGRLLVFDTRPVRQRRGRSYSDMTSSFGMKTLQFFFPLRTLFYAVTPSESSYKDLKDIPDYINTATPFFIVLMILEGVILRLKGMKKRMPRLNDAFSSLSAGLISELPLLLMRNVRNSTYIWVHSNWKIYDLPWDSPWTWWLCMLGVDLGYYWVHRCAHEVNFIWAGHQTHHSSQDYNLSTALRQGVFQIYSSWIFYLPLALFVPPTIFVVHIQFNLLYQFWIHTETINRLGPLEYILNTPSHHRVHHGVNRYCIDKNYAGVLIIWDRIFGTFVAEKPEEEVVYGLTHQLNSWNPVYIQINHWRRVLATFWSTPGLKNKMSIMLCGPGWETGKPRLGLPGDIPDVHAPAMKYNSSMKESFTNIYSWIQLFLALILYETLSKYQKSLTAPTMLLAVLLIVWTLTNIGFFYDQKPYASWSEISRCLLILLAQNVAFRSGYPNYPIIIPALRYDAIFGILICVALLVKNHFRFRKKLE